jgi:peptide deformylase
MSVSIKKFLVQDHMKSEDEKSYLHKPLFNVNMRLYNNNHEYRHMIRHIIEYMCEILYKEFNDYPSAKGISGANVGIPFNIIVAKEKDTGLRMINPGVIEESDETRIVKSNCGSLVLPEPIEVQRHKTVTVRFFDIDGESSTRKYKGALACTIQHEIDHNNGVTIEKRVRITKN